jgi:hypothetical protein
VVPLYLLYSIIPTPLINVLFKKVIYFLNYLVNNELRLKNFSPRATLCCNSSPTKEVKKVTTNRRHKTHYATINRRPHKKKAQFRLKGKGGGTARRIKK